MDGALAVTLIFLLSIAAMLYLILRKPCFSLRIGSRTFRLDSYFIGALIAPVLIACLGLLTPEQILQGLRGSGGLNPLGVLVLFFSMVFMSIYLDTTGFFEYCARIALRYADNHGVRLFLAFYAVISILTIFISNDVIVLTFTLFIYYFTKHAGIDPLPYLFAEFFAANTWSIMLYIGNPTNIVLASAFNLDFLTFFRWMVLPTIVAGLVNLSLLYLLFKKRIALPFTREEDRCPTGGHHGQSRSNLRHQRPLRMSLLSSRSPRRSIWRCGWLPLGSVPCCLSSYWCGTRSLSVVD